MKSDGRINTSCTAGTPTASEVSGAVHRPASGPGLVAGVAIDDGRPESPVPAKAGVPERRSAVMASSSREVRRRIMVVFLSGARLWTHPRRKLRCNAADLHKKVRE